MKIAIERSIDNKIPPIKIENIRDKYPQWYTFLINRIFINYKIGVK